MKQKQSEEEDDIESPSSSPSGNQKLHVEFKEPTVMEEDSTEPSQEKPNTSKVNFTIFFMFYCK